MARPEGFARHFVSARHSLALKLRNARFRLLIVEPFVALQLLSGSHPWVAPDKLKTDTRSALNLWRAQKDSNPQPSDP